MLITVPAVLVLLCVSICRESCNADGTRQLSERAATTVWTLSSVPSANDPDDIIRGFGPLNRQWGDESIGWSTKHSSSPALQIHYAQGSYSKTRDIPRGAGFYSTPPSVHPSEAMILQYDVFFENFGFGNGGKLAGLFGGDNSNGAYACSGGNNPSSCFSLRLMWRKDGDGEIYAYLPANQEPGFINRDDVITHNDYGSSIGRGQVKFQNNKWLTVTEEVHLNTVGNTNGWVKLCVKTDGNTRCYTANNLNMRNSNDIKLKGMVFSTFFGGSSSGYAAPNDCYSYYKNFKISLPVYSPLVG